jgi:signal transduction histidine kinase
MSEMDTIIALLMTGGRDTRFETARMAKDGTRVWVSLNAVPIRDADGTIDGGSIIARDITPFKRSEAILNRRQIQMDAILDAAREAMVLVAPDGSIAKANRRFSDLLGLDAHDQTRSVGTPLLSLSESFRQRFGDDGLRALIATTMSADRDVATVAIRQIWPEAHEFELSAAAVRGGDGDDLGHLYSFLDVTHEREVDRLKNDFVATVSHELRTPLTAISGFVDLMVNGTGGELPTRAQHYLNIVQTNNRRLTAIVDDLLDISRIESGKVNLSRQTMDIATTINAVVASFEPQLMAKKQSLLLNLPVRLPQVWADSARVEQILSNLLSNAHKYTPDGGAITIATHRERDALRIEIMDTGIGITPSEQERLFTKFFRSSNPHARLVSGTGLGLAITKSLVDLHDGTMTVISAPGQGSIFSFTLPLDPGEGGTSDLRIDERDAYPMTPLQPALSRPGNGLFDSELATVSDQLGSMHLSAPIERIHKDVRIETNDVAFVAPVVNSQPRSTSPTMVA